MTIQRWAVAVGNMGEAVTVESALLQAGLAGDRAALDRLLALHERPVLAVCRGILGHAEDAEDAVQETFYRALCALPSFRRDASFRTWILRIAVNVSLNRRRDRRPSEPWVEEQAAGAGVASPEAIVLLRLQMEEALAGLPDHRRVSFLLREREGWTIEEIGAAMGWNTKRVYNELGKARRALADWQARAAREGAEP